MKREGKDSNKGNVIDNVIDYHTGNWGSVPWGFLWRGGSRLLIHQVPSMVPCGLL